MLETIDYNYVRSTVRQVPDFPKPGILFLDVTTIVKDPKAFNQCIDFLYEKFIILQELNQEVLSLVRRLHVN